MKRYLHYFRIWFIILGILLGILGVSCLIQSAVAASGERERTNQECLTKERVFDYADVLTDKEEAKLRKLIAKREVQTGSDIILVTLNESLEDYAKSYDEFAYGSDYAMIFADNFYDENKFGYDKACGDGVILVDNWYREADGNVYTWLSTAGKVYARYSEEMINTLLDRVYEWIETNPYLAYKAYINSVYHQMNGIAAASIVLDTSLVFVLPIIVAIIYIFANYRKKAGKKTTTATAYVSGGAPNMRVNRDVFINKTVTRRHIERNTTGGNGGGGGGFGGGHVSSGGISHGGGGHSR